MRKAPLPLGGRWFSSGQMKNLLATDLRDKVFTTDAKVAG
jgi:hypothetical protein